MRLAVVSDIHANLPALEAVIADLERQAVDAVVVLGDLVGYGAWPNECIDAVESRAWPCVAGNHDLIALGKRSDERCIPMARRTLDWTRRVLTDESVALLSALPLATMAHGVVLAHGTLDDPQEYMTTPAQATSALLRLRSEYAGADILLVGHTHRPWACTADGRVLVPGRDRSLDLGALPVVLNPGAVGQARGGAPRARYLVLDVAQRRATFHALRYDTGRTRAGLRRQGLPAGTYRLRRSVVRRVRGMVRRLLRRLRPYS